MMSCWVPGCTTGAAAVIAGTHCCHKTEHIDATIKLSAAIASGYATAALAVAHPGMAGPVGVQ